MKRQIAAGSMIVLLAFSGCSKQERSAPSENIQSLAGGSDQAVARAANVAQPKQDFSAPRMVIRTASLRLISSDTAKTFAELEQIAANSTGYIETSRSWRENDQLRASMTMRVPEAKLQQALTAIRGTARRVDNEQLGGNDVSQEFVDLGAHLRNYEATEKELRELLSTIRQRSQKASEVLEIHRELTTIRGEIERVKGRMNYLQTMTALATIVIEIAPDAVAQTVVKSGWEPVGVLKDAMRATVTTFQLIASFAIWLVVFILPIALLFVAFLFLIARVLKAFRKKEVVTA